MELFSTQDLFRALLSMFEILGLFKDAVIGAAFTGVADSWSQLRDGKWIGVLGLLGGLMLLWRLKSWILGFLYHSAK